MMESSYTFDYSKLKGKIVEKYGSQTKFVEQISMSEVTFIKKIKSGYFTQDEIKEILFVLNIPIEEVYIYFFTIKVRKT